MDQRGRAETFTSSSVSVAQQQQPQQQQRPAPVQSVYRDRSLAARDNNKPTNRFSRKCLFKRYAKRLLFFTIMSPHSSILTGYNMQNCFQSKAIVTIALKSLEDIRSVLSQF